MPKNAKNFGGNTTQNFETVFIVRTLITLIIPKVTSAHFTDPLDKNVLAAVPLTRHMMISPETDSASAWILHLSRYPEQPELACVVLFSGH